MEGSREEVEERAPRRPSLSPSRASDFKTCPLLYRFRTIDRLPERKSAAAVRGTLVHSVLEKLYDLPAAERSPAAAAALLPDAWAELREEPGIAELFAAEDGGTAAAGSLEEWLASAGRLVEAYFTLEDPRRIQPHGREELVSYGGLLMELPYQVHDTLEQFRDGEVEVQFRHRGLDQLTSKADVVANRLVIAIVMAGTMVGSALLGIAADGGPHVWGLHILTWLGYLVASGLGLVLVWSILRSGRI